ncbi:N-formylglutamate amidohydrolase [Candidatus Poriferisodalis sp.]|uniref:N-formylglutamate amidohydrolase n=1 Tax=Candidatus Poriferisodalis sp. TaxID=3101277 RepID=UPI003B027267
MTLPVLLSIPHGGDRIPPEAAEECALSPADIWSDGDACTREIYDLGDAVAAVRTTDVARAIVDLNRAPDDLPPSNPDGVVKSMTADCVSVWRGGGAPDDGLSRLLIERCWQPYHDDLAALCERTDVLVAFDCHSMAQFAPAISPRAGEARPLFCLSNGHGATAPTELLEEFAGALAEAFECDRAGIGVNEPFSGGHITRWHGRSGKPGRSVPWVQIEMNRSWYLALPWYDAAARTVDPARLIDLRVRFGTALEALSILRRRPSS